MQKRRFSFLLISLAAMILAAGCAKTDYVQFLYDSMPLSDSLVHPRSYWEANVAKTLEVRNKMGWDVPEREFRHFVLPLRVNNENLDDFRTVYADSICARVSGMTMEQAALEINHWCHERATYKPSDGRTLGPMALIRSGLGRCGEESVLAVSALRAAGIPARQVYTPRWAHTDDNHAWVEVFVDGKWHFMGACEPEPVLDLGWFNSSVSRAMLLHTKAFGNYDGPEDVISKTKCYTEINVIRNYIPTRRTTVTVVDEEGNPVEGARVEFKIYNYAEFYPVARYTSDASGNASLDTGLGDIVIWASKGDRYGMAVASAESGKVVLDHTFGDVCSFDLDIVPPVENPLPSAATPAQLEENAARLAAEDAMRARFEHPRLEAPELYLSDKDAIDATQEVIDDALEGKTSDDRYVVCPRIELEMLMPYRREILASGIGTRLHSPSEVADWVRDSISVVSWNITQGLRIPPVAVWRGRVADFRSRDIFFVALCRSLGYPARYDGVTSMPQYRDGDEWITVDFGKGVESAAATGTVRLRTAGAGPVKMPQYYYQYTFSKVADGTCALCEYPENGPAPDKYDLEEGYYMMTSGTRLADGSVLAHVEMFNVEAGSENEIPLVLRSGSDAPAVLGSIDAEHKFLPDGASDPVSILSATGRGFFLICVMGTYDEPTIHAKGQLSDLAQLINEWGRPAVILGQARPEGLDNAVYGTDPDGSVFKMLADGVDAGNARLPLIAVADSFGRVVYFSQGYNTSLNSQLTKVLRSDALK
ncbi:MAG: transglutaminase domain-containing protein [Bacteroidales bacterium]|nr:transglutaminase domain-containing protein [Candidatus Equibacterium intestinale]